MKKNKYNFEDLEGFTPMYHGMVKMDGKVYRDMIESLSEAYKLEDLNKK